MLAPVEGMEGLHEEDVVDGRYRIDARIGTGAMGVVYRAFDLVAKETVALKTAGGFPDEDEIAIAALRTEARALSELEHPNVIGYRAYRWKRGDSYIVLEHVTGVTLHSRMRNAAATGRLIPEREALGIVCALASALDAVHARGLVHRDVKPSNVVIEESTGRPVLLDFGLAQHASDVLDASKIAGTPLYMAPEQASGGRVEPRSDLYALACMAFELFAGRTVFHDLRAHSIVLAHINSPPPPISTLRSDLAPFDAVLLCALSKDPSARQPTCKAFANELVRAWRVVRRERRGAPASGTVRVNRPSQAPTMSAA